MLLLDYVFRPGGASMDYSQSFIDDLEALLTELERQSCVLDHIQADLDPLRDHDLRNVLTYRLGIISDEIGDLHVKLNELTEARLNSGDAQAA